MEFRRVFIKTFLQEPWDFLQHAVQVHKDQSSEDDLQDHQHQHENGILETEEAN